MEFAEKLQTFLERFKFDRPDISEYLATTKLNLQKLNSTQANFVLNLEQEVTKLAGDQTLNVGREGIINNAIFDFVKEKVKQTSNRQYGVEGSGFTDEDLIKDLSKVDDIDSLTLGTGDLDTSKDVLLAVVAKLYKKQKQILLDKINFR